MVSEYYEMMDTSPQAIAFANSVFSSVMMRLQAEYFTSEDMPEQTRHFRWLHPGRPEAFLHLCPLRADLQHERGVVAYTSGITGLRTEFHGAYIYHRSVNAEVPAVLAIQFRYKGELEDDPLVQHQLKTTSPSEMVWRDLKNWVTAETVCEGDSESVAVILRRSDSLRRRERLEGWKLGSLLRSLLEAAMEAAIEQILN